ncbi:hypothetical protein HNO91_14470 [Pseudomonas corrugata]|uniref:Uncharacterized protein n=1 Tax=Pseudomonas corrugata TaxID=47879 RepID=A0A7Y5Z810_9PSED|nr:hypothetical protein [Pseudomonas corrugata]NUT87636.1 hypothetical protein [Pseudomonas corrugata]
MFNASKEVSAVSNCKKCHYPVSDLFMYCPYCNTLLDDASASLPSASPPSSATIKHVARVTPKIAIGKVRIEGLGEMDPPEGVTPPFNFNPTPGGTGALGRLVDSKGRGWYLMRNRPHSSLYHWRKIFRAKRKGGGFHMTMRLEREQPSMHQIAADWNHRQWAVDESGYSNMSLEQALVGTGRNADKRKSQGSVMAKFFVAVANGTAFGLLPPLSSVTVEDARRAVELIESGSLSASRYAVRDDQEWLHLRGHGLGGREEPSNLVAGSHGANSEMAAIEMVLQQFDGKRPLTYSVKADCIPGTLISTLITMEVLLNGTRIFSQVINAARLRLSLSEYAHIQDELVNRIVTDGRKGRETVFVPASTS